MIAGAKRGVLLFGLHALSVDLLVAVFTSLFVEYYVHECLLVVKTAPGKAKSSKDGVRVHFSRWGLSLFIVSQAVCAVAATLHRFGFLSLFPATFLKGRVAALPRRLSNEHCFSILFGLSWWLLRFPLLPSAVTFTVVFATVSVLAGSCLDFTARAAREMAAQRPKEGEWIGVVGQVALAAGAAVVFVVALLYDGATPRGGRLGGFHWLIFGMSCGAFGVFSVLQYIRCRTNAEDGAFLIREDTENLYSPRTTALSSAADACAEFRAFSRQTCQRRSMKALLAARALHCYAHTFVLYFFHLVLTLGCGPPQLAPATRAALLAIVLAAPAALSPACAALCAVLGKKRSLSLGTALVAMTGAVALLLAFLLREAPTATPTSVPAAAAKLMPKAAVDDVSAAGVVWCALLLVLQRVLLDAVRELLDLAQEDVVEEDAILFGRASSMAAWTKRLTSAPSAMVQSMSFIVTLVFLAASGCLRAVQPLPPTTETTLLPAVSSLAITAAPPSPLSWSVVASGSTMLALLGLQTCGVAVAMGAVWQRLYNLDGKHLQFVQMATRKRKDEQAVSLV